MGGLGNGAEVADKPEHIGALHHHAGGLVVDQRDNVFGAAGRDGGAQDLALQAGHGFHRFGIMRMQAARENGLAAAGKALGHHHGFGGGGGTVIERSIRHFHAGEQCHLGLEFEQILQRALGDFRLVGRVAGEEFRPLDQMIHRAGNMMLVGASAAEEGPCPGGDIPGRQLAEGAVHFQLALGVGQVEGRQRHDGAFGHITEQRIHIGRADLVQHRAAVIGGKRKVTHGLQAFHKLGIGIGGHQFGEIARGDAAELEEPALAFGIVIDGGGL